METLQVVNSSPDDKETFDCLRLMKQLSIDLANVNNLYVNMNNLSNSKDTRSNQTRLFTDNSIGMPYKHID